MTQTQNNWNGKKEDKGMKMKHILGTVTIVVIIGGTIYAIKKSKDLQKTEEISLGEARDIVSERAFNEAYAEHFEVTTDVVEILDEEEMYILKEGVREAASFKSSTESFYEDEEFEDDEYEERPIIETITLAGEDNELRYEPNSKEARSQFIKMELSEWRLLEDTYQTMTNLFEFPFQPRNDGDYDLKTAIIDYKARFFGFGSIWTKEVTYADVILHYARAAHFNCDESVKYWVEYFLEFNELDFTRPSRHIDEMLEALNHHTYFNEERATFGLFGLTRESMDQAIRIANRNIDRSVTYEIEFNEFLKSCL